MKPIECPDGVSIETNDARIKAELSRRGLLTEFQHSTAIGPFSVMVLADRCSTDFFIALNVNPHDAGLLWYRFVGMGIGNPLVQGMANFLMATAGPVVLVHHFPHSEGKTA